MRSLIEQEYLDDLLAAKYPVESLDGMQLAAADTGRLPEVVVTGEPEAPTGAGGPAGVPEPTPKPIKKPVPAPMQATTGEIKPIQPSGGMGALKAVGELIQSGAEKIDFDVLGLPGIGTLTLKDLTVGDLGKVLVNIAEGFPPVTGSGQTLSPTIESAELLNLAPLATTAYKGGKALAKGVVSGAKSLAPVAGEMFSNYAERTGLVQYVADPNRVFANYSGEYIQPTRRLKTLVDKLESGAISEQSFIEETKTLSSQMKERTAKVTSEDKVRGADEITRRLLGALNPNAQIQLKEETVRFAKWLLDNNPQFANELGISIKGTGEKGTAGSYQSIDMVATIFADKANPTTGVHEILHHTEQMMPVAVQNGILDEWTKSYLRAYRAADPKVQAYLKQIPDAIAGKPLAKNLIMEGFKRGVLDYDTHYQLVNPSEYWAVNATRIMNSRYEAGSWVGKAKVWLNEFAEKAKGAFGLPSDSPVLKGIKDITKGSGQWKSEMLTGTENVAESAGRVEKQRKQTQQRKNIAKGAAVTGAGLSLAGDEE
jgi:hypothetical protein